jgi:hypothetical protein
MPQSGLGQARPCALDGTKIKANASKYQAMSYARMRAAEDKLAAEVGQWIKQAAADAAEDRQHGSDRRGDELPDWVATRERRLAKIREAKAALQAEAQAAARVEGEGEDSVGLSKGSGRPRPPSGVRRRSAATGRQRAKAPYGVSAINDELARLATAPVASLGG